MLNLITQIWNSTPVKNFLAFLRRIIESEPSNHDVHVNSDRSVPFVMQGSRMSLRDSPVTVNVHTIDSAKPAYIFEPEFRLKWKSVSSEGPTVGFEIYNAGGAAHKVRISFDPLPVPPVTFASLGSDGTKYFKITLPRPMPERLHVTVTARAKDGRDLRRVLSGVLAKGKYVFDY